MKKLMQLLAILLACVVPTIGGTFSQPTGIVATDEKGTVYNIDDLLAAGKHIVIHQTFAG